MNVDLLEFMYEDDDEEIISYLNRPREMRTIEPRSNLFETLTDKKFFRRFRLTKKTTWLLLEIIQPRLLFKTTKNAAVSPMNQLLCTLRFYATGSQLITCGDVIGVQEATACRIIHRVTHAIASLYTKFIMLPENDEESNKVSADFYKIAKFPRVIGAIDCTHVRIISPGGDNAEIYRNRKGYFSLNTQCVAGPDLSFSNVVARWHGSAHDSNIWDNCSLRRDFLQGKYTNKVLLGDSGYAQTNIMMTPLSEENIHNRGDSLYQESQIKTRNVVERAYGVWKRRFPILSRGINVQLRRVPGIIIATAVLHNIAVWQREDEPPEDLEFPLLPELPDPPIAANPRRQTPSGNFVRSVLINEYFARL